MKKLSAYQKLKQENEKLKKDLMTLALHPDSLEGMAIKSGCVLASELEMVVWSGNPQINKSQFSGILDKVRNSNEHY